MFVSFAACFGISLLADPRADRSWSLANPKIWLAAVFLESGWACAIARAQCTAALTLLTAGLAGRWIAVWAGLSKPKYRFCARVLFLVASLLSLASISNSDAIQFYNYHGHARWSWPWDSPNIYGLLMGVATTIAIGFGVAQLTTEKPSKSVSSRNTLAHAIVILCFGAAAFAIRGLVHSYSRGAWIATLGGLGFLGFCARSLHGLKSANLGIQDKTSTPRIDWLRRNILPCSIIIVFVILNGTWHFRQIEWAPVRRALSVSNQNDFSWRNRVSAWKGAFQMIAEKPWFGCGWNSPEPVYETFYLPGERSEGAAFKTNDYLTLAVTLGAPALICFCLYVWISLFQKLPGRAMKAAIEGRLGRVEETALYVPSINSDSQFCFAEHQSLLRNCDWLRITCRAGAVVLAVGFWFDGGLFKLPTASTFWILLELGSVV